MPDPQEDEGSEDGEKIVASDPTTADSSYDSAGFALNKVSATEVGGKVLLADAPPETPERTVGENNSADADADTKVQVGVDGRRTARTGRHESAGRGRRGADTKVQVGVDGERRHENAGRGRRSRFYEILFGGIG